MGYYYRMGPSGGSFAFFLICMILALAATVLICVFLLPVKRRDRLTGFLAKVHEFVNFNVLIVEKLLKILYIFSTCVTVFLGIFVLFSLNALSGILLIAGGSVLVRVCYEMLMLIIIGVNSLIQMNRRLGGPDGTPPARPTAPSAPPVRPYGQSPYRQSYEQPVQPPSMTPRMVYCTHCGTRYDANRGGCPNCGEN